AREDVPRGRRPCRCPADRGPGPQPGRLHPRDVLDLAGLPSGVRAVDDGAMADDVIVAEHLTKSYGPTRGVIDLSFSVHAGEVFGFLGPNGAGKSTTIRTMLDL